MTDELSNTGNQTVDAFHDIARICLTSVERLSALNISAARDAIEDQTAMARALLGIRTPGEAEGVRRDVAQPMIDKALAYSRSAYEILAETQSQLSKLTVSQFSGTGMRLPMPVDWSAAFELFRTSARQFSDMAAQNMTAAADTAAAASAGMKKTA